MKTFEEWKEIIEKKQKLKESAKWINKESIT
jgi:hypothetical protein